MDTTKKEKKRRKLKKESSSWTENDKTEKENQRGKRHQRRN